jgi:hypothetical protein
MNDYFVSYVNGSKNLAAQRGLVWDVPVDTDGAVSVEHRWNLTKLSRIMPPPTHWMSHVGFGTHAVTP